MPITRERKKKSKQISRTNRPDNMSLRQWQTELRRQAAEDLGLRVRNLGNHPVFSEFAATNPQTKRTYRVAIRGESPGVNYCSCPDYAVNTLGTCKHIEVVLRQLRRGHRRELAAGFRPPYSEVYVRYGDERQIVFSAGTLASRALCKTAERFFDANGVIRPAAFATFNVFLTDAAAIDDQLRIYDDALAMIAEVRDRQTRTTELRGRYGNLKARAWDDLLKARLLPYQREGVLFAATAGRSLIADDMGLGKTIQAIATAEMLARHAGLERVLVICPTSLKSQWQQEIARFGDRSAAIIQGQTHQRDDLYRRDPAFFKIANYDVVHRDLDAIAAWSPDLVILDEAQRIKNWQTRAARAVKRIESRYAIVLTGTPLENRIEELHSIVEFVDRHRLGPLFAFKSAHEVYEEDSPKVIGYKNLNQVTQTLAPILVRRTKQEVLNQLPPRMDKNFFVPMTEPQWVIHAENRELVARLVAKWRRFHFLSEADQLCLRIALQNMRMSCDSTYLVDHETKHGHKVGELAKLLAEIFERPDAKVVIFSQWLRMNELIEEMLGEHGWGHVHLHGGVPGSQRKELTRALKEDDDCRVFLSTDAGGVGLNLQSAEAVINMDLPWNPAVLEQRIARVHRMGQTRPVRVVNFIAQGTIEQGMLSLLAFKKSVFAGVLDGASNDVFMGESTMTRFMKTVESATANVPAPDETPAESDNSDALSSNADRGDLDATGGAASPSDVVATAAQNGGSADPSMDRAGPAILTHVDPTALAALLQRGAAMAQDLARSLTGGAAPGASARLHRNDATGRHELHIPLPEPAVLGQLLSLFSGLIPPGPR